MKYSKIAAVLCSLILFGLSSCLKDVASVRTTDPTKSPSVIAFGNTGDNQAGNSSTYPGFYSDLGTLAGGKSATININVEIDGADVAQEDITVNLGIDNTLLTTYNTQNGTSYVVPPTTVYSMPASIVIPKGGRVGQGKMTITNSTSYDFSVAYAVPVAITSTSGTHTTSLNYGKAVYSFGLRNPYDGIYSVQSGIVTRYTAPGSPANDALSGSIAGNSDITLTTVGANTVVIGNLQWANNGGGVGGVAPVFITVDPATNLVTMSAGGNPTLTNWTGHLNKYDPATKTFSVAFIWNPTANVRTYEMVLKYKGPR